MALMRACALVADGEASWMSCSFILEVLDTEIESRRPVICGPSRFVGVESLFHLIYAFFLVGRLEKEENHLRRFTFTALPFNLIDGDRCAIFAFVLPDGALFPQPYFFARQPYFLPSFLGSGKLSIRAKTAVSIMYAIKPCIGFDGSRMEQRL